MSLAGAALATRYARQIALKSIGVAGQQKLLHSAIAVPGLGPAPALTARYLVAAGVGRCFTDACGATALEALNPGPEVAPLSEADASTPRATHRSEQAAQLSSLSADPGPLLPEILGALAATEALLDLLELSAPVEQPENSTP